MPNRPTYGELAFDSSGVPPNSTYRIALASNRLQKNVFGDGYLEFMEYGAIDAFLNPGYGTAAGMPAGPTGRQGIKMLTLILWYRRWLMCYKINSA
jgi:hypothetical protein